MCTQHDVETPLRDAPPPPPTTAPGRLSTEPLYAAHHAMINHMCTTALRAGCLTDVVHSFARHLRADYPVIAAVGAALQQWELHP